MLNGLSLNQCQLVILDSEVRWSSPELGTLGVARNAADYCRPATISDNSRLVRSGAPVLVMDLLRPESPEAAQAIVDQYAANEPDILRRDFYNSLLAAFTEDEIGSQLARMNLTRLLIDVPDDRH